MDAGKPREVGEVHKPIAVEVCGGIVTRVADLLRRQGGME